MLLQNGANEAERGYRSAFQNCLKDRDLTGFSKAFKEFKDPTLTDCKADAYERYGSESIQKDIHIFPETF